MGRDYYFARVEEEELMMVLMLVVELEPGGADDEEAEAADGDDAADLPTIGATSFTPPMVCFPACEPIHHLLSRSLSTDAQTAARILFVFFQHPPFDRNGNGKPHCKQPADALNSGEGAQGLREVHQWLRNDDGPLSPKGLESRGRRGLYV